MAIDRQRRRDLRSQYGVAADLRRRRRVFGFVGVIALLIGTAILIPVSAGATAVFVGGTAEMKSLTGQHNGGQVEISGGLLALTIGSTDAVAYCTDFRTVISNGATLEETGWNDTAQLSDGRPISAPQLRTVYWILRNSYPKLSVGELATKAGVPDLDGAEAAAATQASIWNVTDGFELTGADPDVLSLYAWLNANRQELNEEPPPSLSVAAPTVSQGSVGAAVGPFVVTTTANDDAEGSVGLAVTNGSAFADAAMTQPVSAVNDGDSFWVSSTSAGTTQVEASVASVVGAGRFFLGTNTNGSPAQRLVLAADQLVGVQATTSASFVEATPTSAVVTTVPTTVTTITSYPLVNLADTVGISQTCDAGVAQLEVTVNDESSDAVYTVDVDGTDLGEPTRRDSFFEWRHELSEAPGELLYVTVVHSDGRDATLEVEVEPCEEPATTTTPGQQSSTPSSTSPPTTAVSTPATTVATTPVPTSTASTSATTSTPAVVVSIPAPPGVNNSTAAERRVAFRGGVAVQGTTLARTGGRTTEQFVFGGAFLLLGALMVAFEVRARRRLPF